ncbi:hypothetical protein OIU79_018433 [Salix purpurea]|uniref:Uncharacterized protein n=1 Tax=Salix purpurea TaxID=77065 RepID=A0A9Q1ALE4_SALPP|nr:hypothetical protein OIU79_018433 [Salix purpurea]
MSWIDSIELQNVAILRHYDLDNDNKKGSYFWESCGAATSQDGFPSISLRIVNHPIQPHRLGRRLLSPSTIGHMKLEAPNFTPVDTLNIHSTKMTECKVICNSDFPSQTPSIFN